ncbi:hypothetical protein FCOIX_3968 [Fusarium coicis]|nr:hypothetical protein FCOIX_3968 [Fusarium coicis]
MEASSLTNRSEALSFLSGKPSGAMDISRYHNWIIGSLPQLWKPDSESLATKGYGANHAISAQRGVGFVDLTSFLFSESDCRGLQLKQSIYGEKEDVHVGIPNLSVIWPSIQLPNMNALVVPLQWAASFLEPFFTERDPKYSSSTPDAGFDLSSLALNDDESKKFLHIFCRECSTEVGLYNIAALSVTLFKWKITCRTKNTDPSPSSSECLAATLLATISRSGSSKSIITPHTSGVAKSEGVSHKNLHLWVLNPNIVYTASSTADRKTAMKIFYKHIDPLESEKLLTSMTSNVQEISLPEEVIKAADDCLLRSSELLPVQERTFKEWQVGLLERWEPASS